MTTVQITRPGAEWKRINGDFDSYPDLLPTNGQRRSALVEIMAIGPKCSITIIEARWTAGLQWTMSDGSVLHYVTESGKRGFDLQVVGWREL